MKKIYLVVLMLFSVSVINGQYVLSSASYSQNFDGLGTATSTNVAGGSLNNVNVSLNGWFFVETGTSANTTITAGTGSATGGDTYNFGIVASPNRTLACLQSGTLVSSFGFYFINSTGSTITSLAINYIGETWRVGAANRSDKIDFQYSADATLLTNGTWIDMDALDYANPGQGTGSGSIQHSAAVSNSITGLNIINGAGFFIRWTDFNTSGSDDGMGINDFSVTGTTGTPAGLSTITSGADGPATISSVINSAGASITNYSFAINDDGFADDANPTLINQFVINKGPNNHNYLADWTQVVAGAQLFDGTTTVTGTVNPTNITFAALANGSPGDIGYVADNGNKTYSLKIWLKTPLSGSLPTHIHGKQFEFQVKTSGVTTALNGSSGIASNQVDSSGSNRNVVWVVATRLDFAQQPPGSTGINVAMNPAVTVSANDVNGNRDTIFSEQIRITSAGNLSGSPIDVTSVNGLATFSTITHTTSGTGLTLNAKRTTTLDWGVTSNPFDIQIGSGITDYFRSATSADWNTASTWESSPDNSNWIAATLVPNESANTITIRNGHTVTISSAISADQVVIANGGVLTNTAGVFTIRDGAGDDITIQNGAVFTLATTAGPAFGTGTPAVNINSGGILRVSRTGYTGNGAGANSSNYIYQDASILEYTLTSTFSASGVTYFPNVNATTIPVFRTTANITSAGGINNIVINGVLEANGNINFAAAGTKIFRNGIKGTGNITQDATSGQFIINGASAVLGGTGSLTLNTAGMNIAATSAVTLLNNKTINGSSLTIEGSLVSAFNVFAQLGGTTSVLISGKAEVEHLSGLSGMFTNTGTLALGPASTVEYKSTTGAQSINGRSDYFNVIISGSSGKATSGNSVINGTLSLINTIVTTTPANLITLTANASVAGGSSTSYIDGALVRQTSSAAVYPFPIGRGVGNYKPVDVITASADPSSFSVEYFNNGINTTSPGCDPARLQAYTSNEYWDLQRTAGVADAQIRLNYSQAISNGNWTDGTSAAANPDGSNAITVAHYTGSCWKDENLGAGVLPGNAPSGQVSSRNINSFSPITFGYGLLTTLPVTLNRIKATQQSNNVIVEWTNLAEMEIVHYNIERSADGTNFASIGRMEARLNDSGNADYSFIDVNPLAGANYYRIRSFESSGSSQSSIIVRVDIRGGTTQLFLYPNPVTNRQLSYQANNLVKGQYTIRVFNTMGQQVYARTFNHHGGSVTEEINLPVLIAGLYSLQLASHDNHFVKTFIVQ